MLKKKLRLESARLVQRAKLCIPINMAAKHYVNYTGAALRIRRVNKGRGNFEGKIRENRFKKCAQILQHQVSNLKKFFTKHNFRSLETVKDTYK